jgi:hypothetical protein
MPLLTIDQLIVSPDSLLVDGMHLTADIYLNRDFMPFSPPNGRPMTAWVGLNGSPPGSWPASVSGVYIWVIRDSSNVWATPMSFDSIDLGRKGAHTYRAGNGPLWDPGILVYVVLGLRSSPTKVSFCLFHGVPVRASS